MLCPVRALSGLIYANHTFIYVPEMMLFWLMRRVVLASSATFRFLNLGDGWRL